MSAPLITPEEYLELDRKAEYKNEYFEGRVYGMSSGSYHHAIIAGNILAELRAALRNSSCVVTAFDLRIRVSPCGLYTYPDITVVCGTVRYVDDQRDTVTNPAVLFEVLSPSTEARDRGFEFNQYRKIESLREYILVSQDEPHMKKYRRQRNQWVVTFFAGMDEVCEIDSLSASFHWPRFTLT